MLWIRGRPALSPAHLGSWPGLFDAGAEKPSEDLTSAKTRQAKASAQGDM